MDLRALYVLSSFFLVFAGVAPVHSAAPAQTVDRLISSQGGAELAALGILKLEVSEEETTNDGEQHQRSYTLFVDASDLGKARMELPGDIDIACGAEGCWATVGGVLDSRPQAPNMARRTLNQAVFPLLLPHSLRMSGVEIGDAVEEVLWEGRPASVVPVGFARDFFASPVMSTTWQLVVAQDDHSLLATQFSPPVEYQKVEIEGIRYRTLQHTTLEDVSLPTRILLDGIDLQGIENGHVKVVKIEVSVYGPSEPTLFMRPE
jgi:hypothetical protein